MRNERSVKHAYSSMTELIELKAWSVVTLKIAQSKTFSTFAKLFSSLEYIH